MPLYYYDNPVEWLLAPGTYIANIPQQQPVDIQSSGRVTKIVGDFPWGPTNEVHEITSPGDMEAVTGRAENPDDYGGMEFIYGKSWGFLQLVRITDSGHAKAALTVRDPGVFSLDSFDASTTYELEVTLGSRTVTFEADEADSDTALETLAQKVNGSDEPLTAVADTGNDELLVSGDGDESWTGAANVSGGTGTASWTSPEDAYTVEAQYPGAAGNQIRILHHPDGTGSFTLEESWGDKAVRHGPYDYDGAQATADAINEDLEWGVFSWASSFDSQPYPAQPLNQTDGASMSGGSDANLSDNQPYIDGVEAAEQAEDGGALCCAEVPFVDNVAGTVDETENAGLIARLQVYNDKFPKNVSLAQVAADASGTGEYGLQNNIEAGADYTDDQLILAASRVQQFVDGDEETVDLIAFIASALSQIPEHKSPAAASSAGPYYEQIIGHEPGIAPGREDYIAGAQAGVNLPTKESDGTWRLNFGITTDVGGDNELISTKRMEILIGENVGLATLPYQNEPPLPTNQMGAKIGIDDILEVLEGNEEVPSTRMIEGFTNEIIEYSDDYFLTRQEVELWGEMDTIVNTQKVGERVDLDQQ